MTRMNYPKPIDVEEVVEEPVTEEIVEEPVEPVTGLVNVAKLNVRMNPDTNADVACVIEEGTSVQIDEGESTEDFYNVYTVTGLEGYCMKQFITIR